MVGGGESSTSTKKRGSEKVLAMLKWGTKRLWVLLTLGH